MILHVPHSSDLVPSDMKGQFLLSEAELLTELNLLTDRYTDELFTCEGVAIVHFPISRLIVDVERFQSDADEPMSKVGMGVIYTRTASGKPMKTHVSKRQKDELIAKYYNPHHQRILAEVKQEIAMNGYSVIIDCHSFPSHPLPCDMDQAIPRPQFCIGTNPFHTPDAVVELAVNHLLQNGYTVKINQPYSGTLVPMEYYEKESRVVSIMIEINRSLYMDEKTGQKNHRFHLVQNQIKTILKELGHYEI